MTSLLDAALAYARIGWHVFPCEAPTLGDDTSGKKPLTKNGKDDATTDEATIRRWWEMFPIANIGIATKPSGLIILDVDTGTDRKTGKPKEGAASLAAMNEHLTPTLTARTGSGAIHAVYARGDAEARQQLHIRKGIDLLGNGYFIAAPSKHWTGGEYTWIAESQKYGIAPLPEYLRTIQREYAASEPREPSSNTGVVIPEKNARIMAAARLAEAWPATGRHMVFLALAGGLAQAGWSEDEITEFTTSVARLMPGCDEKAIADRRPQARDSVDKVERGERVEGWGALAGFVPQEVLDAVQDRLGITIHDFDALAPVDASNALIAEMEALAQESAPPTKPGRLVGDLAGVETPAVVSYSTGIPELDRHMGGGLSTQQVVAVIGPPGAGKSSLVLSWALFLEKTVPVLYITTELDTNEVVARMSAPKLERAWRDIVRGAATPEEKADALAGKRIHVVSQQEIYGAGDTDKALMLLARIVAELRTHYGVSPVILVDYLQELARGDDRERRQKISTASTQFRRMAQIFDASIALVSSTSRSGYNVDGASKLAQANDATAYMALAKESGDVDYIAATILYVDLSKENDGNGWRPGRIAVAKSRHGETGFVGVKFKGATGEWSEFADGVKLMSPEIRQQGKAERDRVQREELILEKCRELAMYPKPERGPSSLLTARSMLDVLGGSRNPMHASMRSLIESGRLVEVREHYINAETAKPMHRDVVMRAEDYKPNTHGPISGPENVADALAGIVFGPGT